MKKILFLVLLSIFLSFAAWGEGLEKRVPQEVTVVFSANVYGEIEPCG
jgi:hypothetical protein